MAMRRVDTTAPVSGDGKGGARAEEHEVAAAAQEEEEHDVVSAAQEKREEQDDEDVHGDFEERDEAVAAAHFHNLVFYSFLFMHKCI